jgi:phosphoribosylaminoimidazole-succinocarboxamide synthase
MGDNNIRIALFGSGRGTSIDYVLNNERLSNLVSHIVVTNTISNRPQLETNSTNIPLTVVEPSVFTKEGRSRFEALYRNFWTSKETRPDVIFLLGWNYILSDEILSFYSENKILVVNLHPALPGSYVGGDAVEQQFNDLVSGNIKDNVVGSMAHVVTGNLDRGHVIDTSRVVVNPTLMPTREDLRHVLKQNEKPLISNVLTYLVNEFSRDNLNDLLSQGTPQFAPFYRGKVRSVTDIGYNLLMLTASNRISAFDRHLTEVPDKGRLLNEMSSWWFDNTRHIIPNHYLYSNGANMVVKKCRPIMLEIVVRAYMTGSSETSVWTKYNNGERNMYGLTFRDGYKKNEPLDEVVVTPTTKGVTDVPITYDEIIEQGYLSKAQTDYIFRKARELFNFGAVVARERGLILVDTKYEFGFWNDEIILMDELHTCDSSRYWRVDSYDRLVSEGREPEKFDKDCIRDYVKKIYTSEEIKTRPSFEIPKAIVTRVNEVYSTYHRMLTGNSLSTSSNLCSSNTEDFVNNYLNNYHNEIVVILAGSVSDREHVEKIKGQLAIQNIYSVEYYKSAHKNTLDVMNILRRYHRDIDPTVKRKIVFVTVAGRSNALSGVVASNVRYPVIACPPFKDKMDMFTNINSSLQCPSKVPVLTVLEPQNVAISIRYMFDNGR